MQKVDFRFLVFSPLYPYPSCAVIRAAFEICRRFLLLARALMQSRENWNAPVYRPTYFTLEVPRESKSKLYELMVELFSYAPNSFGFNVLRRRIMSSPSEKTYSI